MTKKIDIGKKTTLEIGLTNDDFVRGKRTLKFERTGLEILVSTMNNLLHITFTHNNKRFNHVLSNCIAIEEFCAWIEKEQEDYPIFKDMIEYCFKYFVLTDAETPLSQVAE